MNLDKQDIESLEVLEPIKEVKFANPNEETYKITVACRDYEFPPFKIFSAPETNAQELLNHAQRAWESKKCQREEERKAYSLCLQVNTPAARFRALKYCDENGSPKTPNTKHYGLISLENPAGKELYQKAVQSWKHQEKPEKLDVEPEPEPDEVAPKDARHVNQILKPSYDWPLERKRAYVKQSFLGKRPFTGKNSDEILNKQMDEAFESTIQTAQKLGWEYKILEE